MAKMKQEKLTLLCYNMKNADDKYFDCLYYCIENIEKWFNEYWITNFSKEIASDLHRAIDSYSNEIVETFNGINNKIKKQVRVYNENPENTTKLYYKGFKISKVSNTSLLNLNNYLPDGKVGFLKKGKTKQYPINELIEIAEEITLIFKVAIVNSDALTYWEQKNLQKSVALAEKKLKNSLEETREKIIKKEY